MIKESEKLVIGTYDADHDLIEKVRAANSIAVRVYQPKYTQIVLGRGSNEAAELNFEAILADNIPILRRPGGGCAVVLDPGNVIVSAAIPAKGLTETKRWFNRCTEWLIDGLDRTGIDGVDSDGISDLVINGKKIAGSAVHRRKDLVYYSASLLVDAHLPLLESYLAHPPREPEYRKGRSHLDFVTNLPLPENTLDSTSFSIELRKTLRTNIDQF